MHPTYYVPAQDHFPRFVGICPHCSCVFPVVDAGAAHAPAGALVPLARCPQCNGWVGLTERHQARPARPAALTA